MMKLLFWVLSYGIQELTKYIINGITNWIIKHRYQLTMFGIHCIFLIPIALLVTGVVDSLPELFFPAFIFYLLIVFIVVVARSESKKYGKHQHSNRSNNSWWNDDDFYGGVHQPHVRSTYTPKPRMGISKEQLKRKKKKIRNKLLENEELKEKYSL